MEKGTLYGSKCYTIGNLEFDSFASAKVWRDVLKEELEPLGIQILSPLDNVFKSFHPEAAGYNKQLREMLQDPAKWNEVHEKAKNIRNRDLAMVDASQFLIGVLNTEKPTFGFTDEVITAKRNQKPVFLVIPDKGYEGIPIWLASYFKPNWVYRNIEEVIVEVKKINSESIENLNNKYWKLFA